MYNLPFTIYKVQFVGTQRRRDTEFFVQGSKFKVQSLKLCPKDPKDFKDLKDLKDPEDSKDFKDSKDLKDLKALKAPKDFDAYVQYAVLYTKPSAMPVSP